MQLDLQPIDPLSQVVFIHDYLQLVFQDRAFTIYNLATYAKSNVSLQQGEPGFCDALVALINQSVQVEVSGRLVFRFSDGAVVSVPTTGQGTRGPEAWQFGEFGGPVVVEQNA